MINQPRIFNRDCVNRNDLIESLRGERVHAFPNMADKNLVLPKPSKYKN